jgi:hypothetical protein
MTETNRIRPVCKVCGSSDVSRDAEVAWDVKNQEWTLKCVQDQAFCNGECGRETYLIEVELSDF